MKTTSIVSLPSIRYNKISISFLLNSKCVVLKFSEVEPDAAIKEKQILNLVILAWVDLGEKETW